MAIEEPEYRVIESDGNKELRVYASMIVAEVTVSGDRDEANRTGFKLIADYIFGNNTRRKNAGTEGQTIRMTAPVTIAPSPLSSSTLSSPTKIDMTAPVVVQPSNQVQARESVWRVHFVMPKRYTMESLPSPNNPAVTLREIPEKYYAVIGFSGFTGDKKVARKTEELFAWAIEKNITLIGEPELARYNPPWTLPFLRRNEVMVDYSIE